MRISRRHALIAAAAVPLSASAIMIGRRKLRDIVPPQKLAYFGLEDHADLDVEEGTEIMAIDPETGKPVRIA